MSRVELQQAEMGVPVLRRDEPHLVALFVRSLMRAPIDARVRTRAASRR